LTIPLSKRNRISPILHKIRLSEKGEIKVKKLCAVFMAFCLVILPSAFIYADNDEAGQEGLESIEVVKDETVYANLNYDGSVDSIYVVNRLEAPYTGIYTDYGSYSEVRNLTCTAKPTVENNKVSWKLTPNPRGFYYQGTLPKGQGNLPYVISITYKLDGNTVKPEEIVGKEGKIELNIGVKPNNSAKKYFLDNFMLQIQVPISLDNNYNIQAPGASKALVGRTITLAYMILPGTEKEYTIKYDTACFELDSMTMTSTFMDINDFIDIDLDTDKIKEDVNKMSDGTGELIDGTEKLKDGLEQLHNGIEKLSDGGKQIKDASRQLKNGVSDYTSGVSQLAESAGDISSGLEQLAAEGLALSNGFTQLKNGIEAFINPYISSPFLPEETKQQLFMLKQQLGDFENGISQYTGGIAAISSGMTDYSQGISQLSAQSESLVKGLSALSDGISKLSGGLSEMAGETKSLPGNVQSLIDGQTALKDGIDQSMSLFDDLEAELGLTNQTEAVPVSFVSDEIAPRSVQFIIQTPELHTADDNEPVDIAPEAKKSFWEKLLDLFRL